jgi:hypothetical protein
MPKLVIVATTSLAALATDNPPLLRSKYLNQGAYAVYQTVPTC